jgi:hypothetical protein
MGSICFTLVPSKPLTATCFRWCLERSMGSICFTLVPSKPPPATCFRWCPARPMGSICFRLVPSKPLTATCFRWCLERSMGSICFTLVPSKPLPATCFRWCLTRPMSYIYLTLVPSKPLPATCFRWYLTRPMSSICFTLVPSKPLDCYLLQMVSRTFYGFCLLDVVSYLVHSSTVLIKETWFFETSVAFQRDWECVLNKYIHSAHFCWFIHVAHFTWFLQREMLDGEIFSEAKFGVDQRRNVNKLFEFQQNLRHVRSTEVSCDNPCNMSFLLHYSTHKYVPHTKSPEGLVSCYGFGTGK